MNAPKPPSDAACDPPSFEQALAELEGIVHQLEDGDLDLANSLEQYERGVKRLRHCFDLLQQAERKIELLTGVDAQGQPTTEAFSDEPTSSQATAGKRRKPAGRSPANRPAASDVDDSDAVF